MPNCKSGKLKIAYNLDHRLIHPLLFTTNFYFYNVTLSEIKLLGTCLRARRICVSCCAIITTMRMSDSIFSHITLLCCHITMLGLNEIVPAALK